MVTWIEKIRPDASGRRTRQSRGFALVITVSLMVLLALMAVGLLSLATIQTRTARTGDAMSVARANARLALQLAIGDLQKAMGPDRRVTALADIAAGQGGEPLAAGEEPRNNTAPDGTEKGLSQVLPGTRYWTGVFENRDDPELVFEKTPAPRLRRWLVSGSENGGETPPAITPAHQASAVGADGTVADRDQAVVLVGRNSVGSGTASQQQYVSAPLVPTNPGPDSGLRGGFAYWIGDEGMKSRIDIERENDDPESHASLVAQRRGWESVEGFEDYPLPAGDADHSLPSLVSLPTIPLLLSDAGSGTPSPLQSVFHSATTDSRGLLVNTLEGGTRVDLTTLFSRGLPADPPGDAYDNYPMAGGRVIPKDAFPNLEHLQWDHLEDFYRRGIERSDDALTVREHSGPNTAAIAPVITDFRILMGARLEQVQERGRQSTGRYEVHPCGKFAVAIANPYSVPLEWDDDLDFEIINQTPNGNRPSRIWQLGNQAVYIPGGGGYINGKMQPSSESAVFNQAVFRIGSGRLEPGEAHAYTQAGKVVRPEGGANRTRIIDMAPFRSASPFDFNLCVEATSEAEITLPYTMDVRESWQTTQVMLEMRLAGGGSGWLRRIEQFELDNGYFSPNQRRFTSSDARSLSRGPVPMMLYSFQISQPGMDYLPLMPPGYEMGQRASTLRTFADFNLRATNVPNPIASYNPPPYFVESNNSASQLGAISDAGSTGIGFTRNLVASPLLWGRGATRGSSETVLFDVPRQFTSLAQFQHADLTNDGQTLSVGHQPGNAFGNSYATPFVRRAVVKQQRVDYQLIGSPDKSGAIQTPRTYYDISHILNASLWDRYFFSTLPEGGSTPENPMLIPAPGADEAGFSDPDRVASGLMVEGAFNINSTDQNAWKALLASTKHFEHPADGSAPEAAFPRSLGQPGPHAVPPTGAEEDSFSGYRRLTNEELDNLAAEMVRQVRLRGPFVSLSHFVNRSLESLSENPERGRSGALQTALDESGVNINRDGDRNGFEDISPEEDRVTLVEKQGAPRADFDGGDTGGRPADANPRIQDWAVTSRDNNFGALASIVADRDMLAGGTGRRGSQFAAEQGYRSTGIPGWVTQADVLQAIGPVISARSDTFRIRAYGEARDPAGNVLATAYCEAIVQRSPEYVDFGNQPHDRPDSLNDPNQTYGRKFHQVSFRWLSAHEI
jgi:type II secretory pathway pseudopilin PulG